MLLVYHGTRGSVAVYGMPHSCLSISASWRYSGSTSPGRFSVLIRQFWSKPLICWEFGRFLIYPRRDFDSFPGSASRRHEQYAKTTGDLGADITQSAESMSRGRHCEVLSCLTNTFGRQLSLARRLPASGVPDRPEPWVNAPALIGLYPGMRQFCVTNTSRTAGLQRNEARSFSSCTFAAIICTMVEALSKASAVDPWLICKRTRPSIQ